MTAARSVLSSDDTLVPRAAGLPLSPVHGDRTVDAEDRTLVEQFLERRDEASFKDLYRRHSGFLHAMALRLVAGDEDAAADLVEDTWLGALKGFEGFAWKSKLSTWLAGILLNCYRTRLRARRATALVELFPESVASPSPPPGLALDLETAIQRLPRGYREVVVLYHVYGYKHREIAEQLGIDSGTSKSQLSRGLAKLREMLA